MTYTYIRSEPRLWTVGYYDPAGKWQPESDHSTPAEAATRAMLMNGGNPDMAELLEAVGKLIDYRDRAGFPFQLEKLDGYIFQLRVIRDRIVEECAE